MVGFVCGNQGGIVFQVAGKGVLFHMNIR
jgi:hypothetical protein